LASVEITRELLGPAIGNIHEITTVSPCDDDAANADFYFAGSFCKEPCPLLYEVNGMACSGTCTPCSNGGAVAAAWDCSNVDASLVQTCDDVKTVDPFELVLTYLRGSTATTPAHATKAPTASPVAAGGVPAGGTSTMRPTLAPNTNSAMAPTASPIAAGGVPGTIFTMRPTLGPNATAAPTKAPKKPKPPKSAAPAMATTIHHKALAMATILATFLVFV